MSILADCEHEHREWSDYVINTLPQILTWTCLDCGVHGHRRGDHDYMDCFCLKRLRHRK